MSMQLPPSVIGVMKTFNDLGVEWFGIQCTLFVPSNLTNLEPDDAYRAPANYAFRQYNQVPVWIEWFVKDQHRLRKLGIFTEKETPTLARFKNVPEVLMHSYIKLESRYIPDNFDTDEFEIVDVLMKHFYDEEVYRWFKLAPRRNKP